MIAVLWIASKICRMSKSMAIDASSLLHHHTTRRRNDDPLADRRVTAEMDAMTKSQMGVRRTPDIKSRSLRKIPFVEVSSPRPSSYCLPGFDLVSMKHGIMAGCAPQAGRGNVIAQRLFDSPRYQRRIIA